MCNWKGSLHGRACTQPCIESPTPYALSPTPLCVTLVIPYQQ